MPHPACPALVRLLFASIFILSFADNAPASLTSIVERNVRVESRALKGLDYDGWDGLTNAMFTLSNQSSFSLDEILKVRFHRIPGYRHQWNIDHNLNFDYDHPLTSSSSVIVAFAHQEYRNAPSERYLKNRTFNPGYFPSTPSFPEDYSIADEIGVYLSRSSNLEFGGRVANDDGFEIQGLAGSIFDRRGGISQEGVRFDVKFHYAADSLSWKGSSWLNHFGSGDDYNLRTSVSGIYKLSDEANDKFEVDFVTGSRREFYSGIATSRRNDQNISVNNRIGVKTSKTTNIDWDSKLTNRQTTTVGEATDRADHEFFWRNSLEGIWTSQSHFAIINSGVDIQQQEYAGGLTQGRNSRLQISSGYISPPLDSAILETSISHYRFDTPDELDFNDRDELRWHTAVRSDIRITNTVHCKSGFEINLNHLVYIHRSRSGENRWTRQFSLFTEIPWRDRPVENKARFAVSAHYTDYDFAPYDLTQSRLFRTFTVVDTLRYYFNGKFGIEISGAGQLNDHGELNWSEWIQNVAEKGYSYTFTALPFRKTARSNLAAGWLTHRRVTRTLTSDGSSSISEDLHSSGPMVQFSLAASPGFSLEFNAAFLAVSQKGKPGYRLPDLNFTALWTL